MHSNKPNLIEDIGKAFFSKAIKEEDLPLEIKKLTMTGLFNGIYELEKLINASPSYGYNKAKNNDITLFIGATRAGKSAIINLFLGNELKAQKLQDELGFNEIVILKEKNESEEGQYPKIGHKTVSETTLPVCYEAKLGGKDILIVDCPGFGDTRGEQQQIINAWFTHKLIEKSKGVKIINVCSTTSFVDQPNLSEFLGYIKQLKTFFTKEDLGKLEHLIVFNKGKDKLKGKEDTLKKGVSHYIKQHNLDKDCTELLNFFDKATPFMIEAAEVGVELSQENVSKIIEKYNGLEYEKIQPNISIDGETAYWVEKNRSDMIKAVINSLRKSYWQIYKDGSVESSFKKNIEDFHTSKKLNDSYQLIADNLRPDEDGNLNFIDNKLFKEDQKLFDDITHFMRNILRMPKNNQKSDNIDQNTSQKIANMSFEEQMDGARKIVKIHNDNIIIYNLLHSYYTFISAEEKIQEEIKIQAKLILKSLKKPNPIDFKSNADSLYNLSAKTNSDIDDLKHKIDQAQNAKQKAEILRAMQKVAEVNKKQIEMKQAEIAKGFFSKLVDGLELGIKGVGFGAGVLIGLPLAPVFALAEASSRIRNGESLIPKIKEFIKQNVNPLEKDMSMDEAMKYGTDLLYDNPIDEHPEMNIVLDMSFADYVKIFNPLELSGETIANEYWGEFDQAC